MYKAKRAQKNKFRIEIILLTIFTIAAVMAIHAIKSSFPVEKKQEEVPPVTIVMDNCYITYETGTTPALLPEVFWSTMSTDDIRLKLKELYEAQKGEENNSYYWKLYEGQLSEGEQELERRNEILPNYEEGYTEEDYLALSYLIFREASICSYEEQLDVGAVAYNRMATHFSGAKTMLDVINSEGQYAFAIDSNYSINLNLIKERWNSIPVACKKAAREVLQGRYYIPSSVIYQALFKQGSGVYAAHENANGVTYICYK